MRLTAIIILSAAFGGAAMALPANWALPENPMLREYFERRVSAIEASSRIELKSPDEWPALRDRLRREMKDMLGLEPEPPRGDLSVVVTGTLDGDGFVVERFHFQPVPGLYLAANLFKPKATTEKLPAILYLSGHAREIAEGVSFGNKTHYHHHGVWFARHGYVCLILDTIQWGEILGEHHGTHRLGRWWWPSRGYTPAGVEAWNAVRAIDYLVSRPEVDASRIGVTGRSGGGAYTWWVAAIDDRVKVAAPTAGITTLRNHVIDGCIEGHCDCMFMQNTYRWDFDRVAALVAPRPLLILNTDKDDIFPLDGVQSIHRNTRRLYETLGAGKNLGLHIAEGPHKDTQPLNTGAFEWFERHLKGVEPMKTLDEPARPTLARESLRVFTEIPKDERTTRIDETFVPKAPVPVVPQDAEAWRTMRDGWMAALRDKVFGAWPQTFPQNFDSRRISFSSGPEGKQWNLLVDSGDGFWCSVHIAQPRADAGKEPSNIEWRLEVSGDPHDREERLARHRAAFPDVGWACVIPRRLGPFAGDERKRIQLRRRFLLLGESIEGGQVADIRRAIQTLREYSGKECRIHLVADGEYSAQALHAALFEPNIAHLILEDAPETLANGPTFLNVLKFFDMPQALAMAAERSAVTVRVARPEAWAFATGTANRLGWKNGLRIEPSVAMSDVRKIWSSDAHCAFTDLIRHRDEWLCVFREGSGHIPGTNGTIRVLASKDGERWESAALVKESGIDLRDPKISATPDGRLMLLMGGSNYDGAEGPAPRNFIGARTRVAFSVDGRVWSAPQPVSLENQWLWRVTWNGPTGYGVGYGTSDGPRASLTLWRTTDGINYNRVTALDPPAGGELNETTLRFDDTGAIEALVRRDGGNRLAALGRSVPPFNSWTWTETGHSIEGPNFLRTRRHVYYAGRDYPGPEKSPRTVVGRFIDGRARPVAVLPSGGDTSYPGMALSDDGQTLWVSYYSSHEGQAAIYLARLPVAD